MEPQYLALTASICGIVLHLAGESRHLRHTQASTWLQVASVGRCPPQCIEIITAQLTCKMCTVCCTDMSLLMAANLSTIVPCSCLQQSLPTCMQLFAVELRKPHVSTHDILSTCRITLRQGIDVESLYCLAHLPAASQQLPPSR